MTKRACETCRFVKAAGFDNMGWCTHPRLQLGGDAKIYVRLSSLHCRNGWASDLWQPIAAGDATSSAAPMHAELPATVDELESLLGNQVQRGPDEAPIHLAARGEDVVVDETTVLTGASATKSFRTNLKRAHEEMKSRKRESRSTFFPADAGGREYRPELETGPAEEADVIMTQQHDTNRDGEPARASFTTAPIANPSPGRKPLPTRPIVGDVSPVELGEIGRPFPKMTTFPDDDARFSSIPEPVAGFDLPFRDKSVKEQAQRVVGRAGFDNDEFDFPSWGQPEPDSQPPATAADATVAGAESPRRTEWVTRRESITPMRAMEPTAETPAFPPLPDFFAGQQEPASDRQGRAARGERILPDRVDETQTATIDLDAVVADQPAAELDALDVVVDAGQVELVADERDAAVLRWVDIPRQCRTCRDFRPSENGDRGWCTNKRAFSHRRMVDADELPCETSIGGWWLPNDELWLSRLDVSAHSQPTPHLDAWIAQRIAARRGFDEELPVRRRKRS